MAEIAEREGVSFQAIYLRLETARKNAKAKERDEKMAEISNQVEAEAELEAKAEFEQM